jgi:hypothetical protein
MNLLSNFKQCLQILSVSDQRKYFMVVITQALLGFLDLIGIIILGVVGIVAIRGVQSQPINGRVFDLLDLLNLSNLNIQKQVALLGVFAAIVLIIRTILSMYFNWKILNFLGQRSAEISSNLLTKMALRGQAQFHNYNISEIQFILGPGVTSIAIGILGSASTVVADSSSLIIIAIGVAIVDPVIALSSAILFSLTALFFYFICNYFDCYRFYSCNNCQHD